MNDSIEQFFRSAAGRIPEVYAQIESLIQQVHPIELLSQLSLLMMHPENEHPDPDYHGRWQVRIEFIAWIILSGKFAAPEKEVLIDATILEPLEEALESYFAAHSISRIAMLQESGHSEAEQALLHAILTDTTFVRGEGIPAQIEELALGMYSPHSDWMKSNLGFDIQEAFAFADALDSLISNKLQKRKEEAQVASSDAKGSLEKLATQDLNALDEDALLMRQALEEHGIEALAEAAGISKMFLALRHALGVTAEELAESAGFASVPDSLASFLKRMCISIGEVDSDPTLTGLNPLVTNPLIAFGEKYYLPCPPLLYESLLSTFHFDLWRDSDYRHTYDNARADWLEQMAADALSNVFPADQVYMNLQYGPKAHRQELDGLVEYDNRIILLEAKWKTLTLSARTGDLDMIHSDLQQSIGSAYSQAVRAREHIRGSDGAAKFLTSDGEILEIDGSAVSKIYLVSLAGRGSLSLIAANLARFGSLAFFESDDYPWALSLLDLKVVCDLIRSPSELFDYIERRHDMVLDPRFQTHDEWDLLGLYFDGYLDPRHAQFEEAKEANGIVLFGVDQAIDTYLRSAHDTRLPRVDRPKRNIPEVIRKVVDEVEALDQPGKVDFNLALLRLPDDRLEDLAEALEKCIAKTLYDREMHSVTMYYEPHSTGFTLMTFERDVEEMSQRMIYLSEIKKYKARASKWLALGVEIAQSERSHSFLYMAGPWTYDVRLERLTREFDRASP